MFLVTVTVTVTTCHSILSTSNSMPIYNIFQITDRLMKASALKNGIKIEGH